ncbi:MAG: hypothetical protein V3U11_02705 [Planctomycetota bacterium]
MRVGDNHNDVDVKLEMVGKLFGKITGESGKEWVDPNGQGVGGN